MVHLNYYKTALNSVYETGVILNSSANRRHALSGTLKLMQETLSMQRGFILLLDAHTEKLHIEAAVGIPESEYSSITYGIDEGVVGKVFRLGVPILLPDILKEPLFLNRFSRDMKSEQITFIAVPLKSQGETFGVLAVDKPASKMISVNTDVDVLKMIADLIASFLRRIDFFEKSMQEVKEERNRFEAEKLSLMNELKIKYSFRGLAGKSKLMHKVFEKINIVTNSSSSVLIRGESGTGKEVVAKTIHYNSSRSGKPFIAVNCAAVPADLMESELFGGITRGGKGKFELANGGTLFLDEIGDMPIEAQGKLLRVLQDKTIEKATGDSVKADVRILAATNKNLEELVQQGRFRLDLYYRLNVFTIDIPPLRKRREDIPEIAQTILNKLSLSYDRSFSADQRTMNVLVNCCFPGNIRELENCLERAALNSSSGIISPEHIACMRGDACLSHSMNNCNDINENAVPQNFFELSDREKVIDALEKAGWVQAKAARLLNMTVRQINYRIQKYDISVKKI